MAWRPLLMRPTNRRKKFEDSFRRGFQDGRRSALYEAIVHIAQRKFGPIPSGMSYELSKMSADQLVELIQDLENVQSFEELALLNRQNPAAGTAGEDS